MSLDNALRSALVHAGDAIPAEPSRALPGIVRRARAQRRRRALRGAGTALVIAAVVWAPPAVRPVTEDNRQPPAREERTDRRDAPGRETHGRAGLGGGSSTSPSRDGGDPKPRRPADETVVPRGPRDARREPAGDAPVTDASTGVVPRRFVERYEVSYVAGTHLSENAGGGCWNGSSATGSNDCIAIPIGPEESAISLQLVDDEGVVVGATVYQHAGGEGTELVSFCGATDGYVAVEPDALLFVYVDTSARCSDGRPHAGTFVASIR